MKKITISLILLVLIYNLQAQKAIDVLIKKNANDTEMVRRLRSFKNVGTQKVFNVKNQTSDNMINAAKKYLGVPYKFGGTSRSGIDCSGLIVKTMNDLGLTAPHNAEELARFGTIILDKSQLQPGDLIFFTKTYNTNRLVSHAGFVIENNKMLHASSKGVNITSINNPYYYDKYYLFGTRIFDNNASSGPILADNPNTGGTDASSSSSSNTSGISNTLSKGFNGETLAVVVYKKSKKSDDDEDKKKKGKKMKKKDRKKDDDDENKKDKDKKDKDDDEKEERKEKYAKSERESNSKIQSATHPNFPIGTVLEIFNAQNQTSTTVRIGSNKSVKNGTLGISKKTAKQLGVKNIKSLNLKYEVLRLGN